MKKGKSVYISIGVIICLVMLISLQVSAKNKKEDFVIRVNNKIQNTQTFNVADIPSYFDYGDDPIIAYGKNKTEVMIEKGDSIPFESINEIEGMQITGSSLYYLIHSSFSRFIAIRNKGEEVFKVFLYLPDKVDPNDYTMSKYDLLNMKFEITDKYLELIYDSQNPSYSETELYTINVVKDINGNEVGITADAN